MSAFQPFEMERMMSRLEQTVDYNLSESGVHPMQLKALLAHDPSLMERLLNTEINYPHVNGIPPLRKNIAAMYTGATADNVLVTVGAIEANYIAIRSLLNTGDEIIVMLPNYMQIWGIAKNHALAMKTFALREENAWAPDLDELRKKVSSKTKLIAICNPNNPTGRIMTPAEMQAVVKIAENVNAWILADEVYRGAERLNEQESPSFYGLYDKVLAIGSMSKAYGLPGLRLGWIAGPTDILDSMWARHEYITLSATLLSNHLATLALSPSVRPQILKRTREYIQKGYQRLHAWTDSHPKLFSIVEPQAAAIAFARYHIDINSTQLCDRLYKGKSVLIVPGDHFGMDHFVRISFGLPHAYLSAALDRMHQLIQEIH